MTDEKKIIIKPRIYTRKRTKNLGDTLSTMFRISTGDKEGILYLQETEVTESWLIWLFNEYTPNILNYLTDETGIFYGFMTADRKSWPVYYIEIKEEQFKKIASDPAGQKIIKAITGTHAPRPDTPFYTDRETVRFFESEIKKNGLWDTSGIRIDYFIPDDKLYDMGYPAELKERIELETAAEKNSILHFSF